MDLYKVKYDSIEAIALRCVQNAYPDSDKVLDQMKSKIIKAFQNELFNWLNKIL